MSARGRHAVQLRSIATLVAFGVALLIAAPASADAPRSESASRSAIASTDSDWFKVLLDGRKVGALETQRQLVDGRVIHRERMTLELLRDGASVVLTSASETAETIDGKPLSFSATVDSGGTSMRLAGEIVERTRLRLIETGADGTARSREQPWIAGTVMPEGARLAGKRRGFAPGTRYRLRVFDPSSAESIPTEITIGANEEIEIAGTREALTRVTQRATLSDGDLEVKAWHRDADTMVRALMPVFGMTLEIVRCDAACARAPNQSPDILAATLIRSPRALDAAARAGELVYTLRVADARAALPALAPGQRAVRRADGAWQVTVATSGRVDPRPPTAADTRATRWLESDDAALIAAARAAIGDDAGADARSEPAQSMAALTAFVRRHVADKGLGVAYASARTTLDARAGDCTEHALLLVALARSVGIPARVVTGIAYAERFAGRDRVFVPHAWATAYVDGAWRGFDAALPDGAGAGHIAFSVGDGEPSGFFQSLSLLGGIEITAIASPKRASGSDDADGAVQRLPAVAGDRTNPAVTLAGVVVDLGAGEISGLAASRRLDDLLWANNDGGNRAELLALDRTGAVRARVAIDGVANVDWEDLAAYERDGESLLVIGDIGDNGGLRDHAALIVVPEPDATAATSVSPRFVIRFRYPDGPRDAESLAVSADGRSAYILSKRSVPAELFRVSLERPAADEIRIARPLARLTQIPQPSPDELSTQPDSGRFRAQPTAMDLRADGSVIVLTYRDAYFFRAGAGDGVAETLMRKPMRMHIPPLPQGEAIAFSRDGRGAYATSERIPAPLLRIYLGR